MARVESPQVWAEVPAAPSAPESRAAVAELSAPLLVAVGPMLRTRYESWGPLGPALQVGGVAALATLIHAALPKRWWWARLLVTAIAGVVVAPIGGVGVGLWVAGGLTLVDWALRRRPPLPFLPEGDPSVRLPVVVLIGTAAVWGHVSQSRIAPLLLTGTGLVLTLLMSLLPARFRAVSTKLSDWVGNYLGRLVFGVLGLLVVVIPWLGQRIVRADPLAAVTADRSAWIRRSRRDIRASQPWTTDSSLRELPIGEMWRRRLVAPTVIVLVAATVAGFTMWPGGDAGEDVPGLVRHLAFEDDMDWYPQYFEDISWYFPLGFDPTNIPRLRDARSTTVNVVDGHRVSWRPPAGDERRITVWFFGGSTAFGLGQRDEHTIASELARVAWEDGIALDVTNYGVPADMHWHGAYALAWDAERLTPPDLAVFYDGINDLTGALHAQDLGCGTRSGPLIDPALDRVRIRDTEEFGAGENPYDGPDGATLINECDGTRVDTVELAEHALDRYERSRAMARITADAHGVEPFWFWQPSAFTKPQVPGEPAGGEGDEWSREWWAAARERLDDEVIDIGDSLDTLDEPTFYDTMHHDETAARAIAEAIYVHLEPALRRQMEQAP